MNTRAARLIGDVVLALLDHEHLTVAFVCRVSGLSRLTVEHLRDGKTYDPTRRTLTRLARGLATHPRTLVLDNEKMARYERELHIAAGYADPTSRDVESMLELLLTYRFGSQERARAWDDLMATHAALDVAAIRALSAELAASRE